MNKDFELIERLVTEVFEPKDKHWRMSKSRVRTYSRLRQVAHWAGYYYMESTTMDIGFWFGRFDSSSVLHNTRVVNAVIQVDYDFSCKIRDLMALLERENYTMIHSKGRKELVLRCNPTVFPNIFAEKRKRIKHNTFAVVRNKVKPALPPTAFTKLKQLRELVSIEADLDKVIETAKEISRLESLMNVSKHAVQHTY